MCVLIEFRQFFNKCPSFVQFLSNICPSCPIWTNIGKNFKTILRTMKKHLPKTKDGQKLDMDKISTNWLSNSVASPHHFIDKTWIKI